jgi:hypothetical protein
LKPSSVSFPASVTAILTAVVFALAALAPTTHAQAPQAPPAAPEAQHDHQGHNHAAPTNLQVLPKTMTGEQVHELMETWEAYLGVKCSTCHAADPKNIGPNGRPRLNYADDSKPEKASARLMYKMTEEINTSYVSKIPNSDVPVTCGTCHRGHFGPEPFVIPKDDDDHDHPPAPKTPPPAK